MICTVITQNSLEEMVVEANKTKAELVELRLDYLKDLSNMKKIQNINKPVIATCMPKWEGGLFPSTEEERISLLLSAMKFSQYVTIELNTDAKLRNRIVEKAKELGVKIIVANHNFQFTPRKEEIFRILEEEEKAGADVAKVAFMPRNNEDVLILMSTLLENSITIPVIAISMGSLGKISRILAPTLGSYLTYASSSKGKESAPGQLPVEELKSILNTIEG